MNVFWKKGYEGASLSDLTKAMKINRPSLYATFGNKEALFRKVLARYAKGPASFTATCLKEPNARAIAERRLYGAVAMMTNPEHPWGCLATQAAPTCGQMAASIWKELIATRAQSQKALRQRLERARAEGDLPHDCSPADLAAYLCTLGQGLSLQAASGANPEEMRRIVELALKAWPEGRQPSPRKKRLIRSK